MNFGTLSTYLKPESPTEKSILVKSQTLALTIMAAKGLEFMHSKKLNHLDIKPENVLIHQHPDGSLVAKLSDFGSTLPEGSDTPVFQTPGFIPPEGKTQPYKTSKFDIYAFGCMLINVILLENYSFMWEGSRKTWDGKKAFLSKLIQNQALLDCILSCINDLPRLRPDATLIVQMLECLEQKDFEKSESSEKGHPSIIAFSTDTAQNASSKDSPTTEGSCMPSMLFANTPGNFLLSELGLKNPARWTIFTIAFKERFELNDSFDEVIFERQVQPKANTVTAHLLNNNLFNGFPSIQSGENEEVWVEAVLEHLTRVIQKCVKQNSS
ncbi:hypothetical protein HDV02_005443 [Globomyces sp. JEL0801]|nr:hypothetical protein HDV02_005443 [Globomyces sp. JEL0801]